LKRVDFPTFGLPTIATILPIVFLIEPAKVRKKNGFGGIGFLPLATGRWLEAIDY
jgi:hypothetical protein